MKKVLSTLVCILCSVLSVIAKQGDGQNMNQRLFCEDYEIDTTKVEALGLRLNALGFFRDNEYTSVMTQGYSLPGAIVSPRLTYTPISKIYMELGVHALLFNGANKYPNFAYHDIGTWKGNQYQSGVHLLPWVRLQAKLKNLNIVVGDIYGGETHGLIEPLWNAETNLSQDPEMGLQLLWDLPHLHMDTWLNWQSYIFKLDTHQEAFTVGTNWKVLFGKPDNRVRWYMPIQVIVQHRGGEQDTTSMGVQTIYNASIGTGVRINSNQKVLSWMNYELNFLAAYQQAGQLWPFKTGFAAHAAGEWCLWNQMHIRAGYFCAPKHFVSLYGNTYFGTLSLVDKNECNGINTLYANIAYSRTFAKHYTVGADIYLFQSFFGKGLKDNKRNEFNFAFGLYLHVDPTIILKRWK